MVIVLIGTYHEPIMEPGRAIPSVMCGKRPSRQPAHITDHIAHLDGLATKGQRAMNKIADLHTAVHNTNLALRALKTAINSDYNAFSVVIECARELIRLNDEMEKLAK